MNTGRRPKAVRIGLRIAAGTLCPVSVVYGIDGIRSVHAQMHGWTMLMFGVVFGVYAIFGRTGIPAFDE